jgi:methylated-DNA-[protein]-cysteine S-methyltransferase
MKVQPALDATLRWPLGQIGIRMAGDAVAELRFLGERDPPVAPVSAAAAAVAHALSRYFDDPTALPDLPTAGGGTDFQKSVWRALRGIAPGQVLSYGELARRLGTAPRAIGGACRANPVPLLVPCHRVVASQGVGGFSGARDGRWLAIKRWLLTHEGVEIR